MFIILMTYTKSAEEIDAVLTEHHRFLREQYAAGNFLMSGRKVPRNGGVIIADVADRSEIDEIVQSDPFFINGVADYNIIEFVPSMTSAALSVFRHTPEKN